jgi:hypothetical protein
MLLEFIGFLIIGCLVGMLTFISLHLKDSFYGVGVGQKRPVLSLILGVVFLGMPYGLSYWLESASRELGTWFDLIWILMIITGAVLLCVSSVSTQWGNNKNAAE